VVKAEVSRSGGVTSAVARCRFCDAALSETVVDLGMSPLCESFVAPDRLNEMEPFYPLHVWICERCLLVQLEEYVRPDDIFSEYAYFSSYSTTWVSHARAYVEEMIERLGLSGRSLVVEVGSNDGYLLQHFVEHGVPVLGIDPAANVAVDAEARGVPTLVDFFGRRVARDVVSREKRADLVLGNNVLAQVPDLNDFVAGLEVLIAPDGVVTLEFPHVARLVEGNQFDTIYHEHFSYFSFTTTQAIFAAHGLQVFDVTELPTHGGSLRVFAQRADGKRGVSRAVAELAERERAAGYRTLEPYRAFAARVEETKRALLTFLIEAKRRGAAIAGYGAPGKGNTLLNYCGIRTDFLDYTVDRNPYKHGLFLPGTRIPIHPPERLADTRPDYILILPWNLRDEIIDQLDYARAWGAQFVVPIPTVEVLR
jgi:2-polyprenyl-3-methyl-5-hydroxy-6-metoxy-1,4-benzoquinol methylase